MIRIILFAAVLPAVILTAYPIQAQHTPNSPQQSFQTAVHLYQEGLFAESIPHFQELIEHSDNRSVIESSAYFLTRALLKTDPEGKLEQIEWYVRTFPNSRNTAGFLIELGHEYVRENEFHEAISRFERALKFPLRERQRLELLYHIAETAVEGGSYEVARSYYLQVADEYSESAWAPRALYARGRLYLEEEEYTDASEAFELLRTRYPDDPVTIRIGTALGESYYQQARYEDAIEAFDEAIPYLEGETRYKAVYLTGESHNALGQLDEAARFYRYYLNRNPDGEHARLVHYGLGWVFHKQEIYHWSAQSFERSSEGNDEIARKSLYYKAVNEKLSGQYRKAMESFRNFGSRFTAGLFVEQAYYEWAVLAFEVGRYVEAIEVLQPLARNLETLEEPGKILTFLGESFYANEEYTRALQTFQIAAELTNIDPALQRQARFQRAWILYHNQVYEEAQQEFEQVWQSSPGSALGGEALFWSADSYYQTRNYGQAATRFARFTQNFPDHEMTGAATYALGWSYFMMGDYENAAAELNEFRLNYEPPDIALFPYETDTQLRIGDSYFALGRYQEALEYYNMTIGADPGGDYAMYQVANSYYRMNRNFEAVTEFRRVLRIYPFSTLREQAQYNIAYIYLNTGNYDQAIQEFQTVIERYPDTEWAARSQYNIGDAYYNAGNYEQAISAYQTVLDRYPRSDYIIEAVNGIQYAQMSETGEDRSTEVLEEFLADNPTSTTADRLRYRQAETLFHSGDYDAAVREFRQYIRITNSDDLIPEALFNMADAQARSGNHTEAMESYQAIADEYPDSDRYEAAVAELGRLTYDRQEFEESRNYFSRLLDGSAQYHHQAYLGMGNASLALGEIARAREEYEEAMRVSPDSEAARIGIANIYFRENRFQDAEEIYTDVVSGNTTEVGAEAQFMLGRIHQVREQYQQALENYSRVTVLFEGYESWVAEARYRTAEVYILQGNRGEANSLLNSIIETYPDTRAAERARRILGN
ncbi:MAG: tetratricopeptide repeat protein [Balneolaceae bacterium]